MAQEIRRSLEATQLALGQYLDDLMAVSRSGIGVEDGLGVLVLDRPAKSVIVDLQEIARGDVALVRDVIGSWWMESMARLAEDKNSGPNGLFITLTQLLLHYEQGVLDDYFELRGDFLTCRECGLAAAQLREDAVHHWEVSHLRPARGWS